MAGLTMHKNFSLCKLSCTILVCCAIFTNVLNAILYLDSSFGPTNTGIVMTNVGFDGIAYSVMQQTDGSIVLVGSSIVNDAPYVTLAAYSNNGILNTATFGTNGILVTPLNNNSLFQFGLVQADGKIVVAGYEIISDANNIALARYSSSGSPDGTFGSGGIVTTSFGDWAAAYTLAIQADGKLVAGGVTGVNYIPEMIATRYSGTNGALDTAGFGSSGFVTKAMDSQAAINAILVQPANQYIVTAGSGFVGNIQYGVLGRYDTAGVPDPSFGTSGFVTQQIISSETTKFSAIGLQSTGKIIVLAQTYMTGLYTCYLARYTTTGVLDPTFNAAGAVPGLLPIDPTGLIGGNGIAIQTDDKIVVAGFSGYSPAVMRYLADGSALDTTFGNGGIVVTLIGDESATNEHTTVANGVLVQSDGKIVIAGTSDQNFFAARYFGSNTTDIISIDSPGASPTTTNNPFTISGSATESNYTVKVYLDTTNLIATTTTDAYGHWDIGSFATTAGAHTITAELWNSVPVMVATQTINISVNAGPASVSIASPANGSTILTSTTDIYGGSNQQAYQVQVSLDSVVIATVTTDSMGQWNAGARNIPAGNHTIDVALLTTAATAQSNFTVSSLVGPMGPTGLSGATGISGVTGTSGATGQSGITGASGVTGFSGTTGLTGFTGVTGAQGSGITGQSGSTGFSGQTGLSGITGVTGLSGITGLSGATGISGRTGETGLTGRTGNTGFSGLTGMSGITGFSGRTGTTGLSGTTGQSGITGASGVTGFSGTTGGTGFTGITGAQGSGITGQSGSTGFSGQTGLSGITGVTGLSGITGLSGATGISGRTGETGLTGRTGNTGFSGSTGMSGITGFSGITGTTGLSGTTGQSGITGASGVTGFSGTTGSTGFTGVTGAQGSGITGQSGSTGFSGQTGISGITGVTGLSGITGLSGATGISGRTGETGLTGRTGNTGFSGSTGMSGITGFSGRTGTTGLSGTTGQSGITGASGVTGFSGTTGVTGFTGVTGAQGSGITGQSGSTGFSGQTGTSGTTGFSGVTGASGITGISGTTGTSGVTGFTGRTGATGADGTGLTGASGLTGRTGTTGFSGTTGASGVTGFSGITGATGTTGFSGITGVSASTGISGVTGISGLTGLSGITGLTGRTGITGITGATGISPEGNVVRVDSVYGNDTTCVRNRFDLPCLTIAQGLSLAQSGDLVWVFPGTYAESGLVVPSGVAIRGVSLNDVKISKTGVTADTDLLTMGDNTRVEDVALTLTSAGHYTLRGVLYPGTTTTSAKLRTATVTVDNSGAGAGTSNVYGIHSYGTGTPDSSYQAIRAVTVKVNSAGSGVKRALLVNTAANYINVRDSNFYAVCPTTACTNAIGAETNFAGSALDARISQINGDTADISQTLGTITLATTVLGHSTANGNSFSLAIEPATFFYATTTTVGAGLTRYLLPGTAAPATADTLRISMSNDAVIKNLRVRAGVTINGRNDVYTILKNGGATTLTVTIVGTGGVVSAVDSTHSVAVVTGDALSLRLVTGGAFGNTDEITATIDVY